MINVEWCSGYYIYSSISGAPGSWVRLRASAIKFLAGWCRHEILPSRFFIEKAEPGSMCIRAAVLAPAHTSAYTRIFALTRFWGEIMPGNVLVHVHFPSGPST